MKFPKGKVLNDEQWMNDSFNAVRGLVGHTPMIQIFFNYKGESSSIFAKCEYYNFSGSVKDRIALHILQKAYQEGRLKPGDTIVEATSGNTGIAFASLGTLLGHKVKIIMPDWLSRERFDIMKIYGSELITISKAEGGFIGSIKLAEEIADAEENIFLPRQFSNEDNSEAHFKGTGPEIWNDMFNAKLTIDAFVAGVGTGGTVMGVGKYLKSKSPMIHIHPVEPAESPTLSTGYKVGSHRIQGISDEFIPGILKLNTLDEIISINDGDAIIAARKLAREIGLGVGISSGCNVLAAIKVQQLIGPHARVVTVLSDSNTKYLTTDLIKDEKTSPEYMTSHLSFGGFTTFQRSGRSSSI